MLTNAISAAPGFMMFAMIGFWAGTIIVHVLFAAAVFDDARSLPEDQKPILVGPGI
jgi:hypothetical protein